MGMHMHMHMHLQVPADAMWQLVLEAGSPATLSVLLFAMRYAFESVRRGLTRRRTSPESPLTSPINGSLPTPYRPLTGPLPAPYRRLTGPLPAPYRPLTALLTAPLTAPYTP